MKTITDGSAVFVVRDKRMQAMVDFVYPVGIVVAIANNNKPDFMNYGTWEQVANDRVLWGAGKHAPGTVIAAGLPNITGHDSSSYSLDDLSFKDGAFNPSVKNKKGGKGVSYYNPLNVSLTYYHTEFNASLCNPIYGNSTTVQPDAYVVTYWQRTA